MATTLTGFIKDYKDEPLAYQVIYGIPIIEKYFGKWKDQCIALTKEGSICTISSYKENPLNGLCHRHYARNIEAGGSAGPIFP